MQLIQRIRKTAYPSKICGIPRVGQVIARFFFDKTIELHVGPRERNSRQRDSLTTQPRKGDGNQKRRDGPSAKRQIPDAFVHNIPARQSQFLKGCRPESRPLPSGANRNTGAGGPVVRPHPPRARPAALTAPIPKQATNPLRQDHRMIIYAEGTYCKSSDWRQFNPSLHGRGSDSFQNRSGARTRPKGRGGHHPAECPDA